ncbi:MAG: TIR domain-containing protein [Anaerolineae bacterium]|nr:TIR domain-containing protein [Anaerolineae bacterium]
MTDVMISYSRKDLEFVRKLYGELSGQGRDIWVDWEDIPKTADWWSEIKDGVEKADSFIFVISPDSVDSEVCGWEINHAVELKKRLIPVLRRDVVDPTIKLKMHSSLNAHNWIFARDHDDFTQVVQQVVSAMDTDLEHVKAHTRLMVRAREWDKAARDASFLLRGNDLTDADRWFKNSVGKKPEPDSLHRQYIESSQKVAIARRRNLLLGISVSAVIALFALIAVWQAIRAENARNVAVAAQIEAQDLGLASNALVAQNNGDLDIAIALAMEANRPHFRPETLRALAEAAYAPGTSLRIEADAAVTTIALSPDNQSLFVGLEAEAATLYDLKTGSKIRSYGDDLAGMHQASFSSDGKTIFAVISTQNDAGGDINSIVLWDVATGDVTKSFTVDQVPVAAAMTSDAAHFLTADPNGTLLLWEVATGETTVLEENGGLILAMDISDDDSFVVTGSDNSLLKVWSLPDGNQINEVDITWDEVGGMGEVTGLVINHAGTAVFLGANYQTYHLVMKWIMEGDDSGYASLLGTTYTDHSDTIRYLATAKDERYLLTGSDDNHVILWDTYNGVPLKIMYTHENRVSGVMFTANGEHFVSSSWDKTVRLIDMNNGAQIARYQEANAPVWEVTFSPDGKYVIAGNSLTLIDVQTGEHGRTFQTGSDAQVFNLSFSPDGQWLDVGLEDGTVIVWDVATGKEIQRWQPFTQEVWISIFSPDGNYLLTTSQDGTAKLWDTATWSEICSIDYELDPVWAADFSPDSKNAVIGTQNGRADWVSIPDCKVIETKKDQGETWDVAYSLDGKLVAMGHDDNRVSVWNALTRQPVKELIGHHGKISGVSFSHDSAYIISGSYDNRVIVWDVATGQLLRTFIGHTTPVTDVTISPDGKIVVSGSLTGSLRLWHVHSPEELVEWTVNNRFVRPLTCDERIAYDATPLCSEAVATQ